MPQTFTTTSIWAALPHGFTGPATARRLRLAVAVSLRLGCDPSAPPGTQVPLSSFPPGVQNWAQTVATLQFAVEVDNGPTTPASAVSVPRPELWTALFPPAAPVRLYGGVDPLASRPVNTFPNATLANGLSKAYPQVLGSSPIDPPGHAMIAQALPELAAALTAATDATSQRAALALQPGSIADQGQLAAAQADLAAGLLAPSAAGGPAQRMAATLGIAGRLAQLRGGQFTPVVPDQGGLTSAFTQLLAFHRGPTALGAVRPGQPRRPTRPRSRNPTTCTRRSRCWPTTPCCCRCSVSSSSWSCRCQAVPRPLVGATTTPRLRVHPLAANGQPLPGALAPWTAYTLDGSTVFTPAPAPGTPAETMAGLLNVTQSGTYQLVQIDVDGAALSATTAIASDQGDGTGLPAIRTAGISLSRLGHGQSLQSRFSAALTNNAQLLSNPDNVTLFDVDVVRGYRLDVGNPADGSWQSLHQRQGGYTFLAGQGGPVTIPQDPPAADDPPSSDEGHAQPAVVDYPGQGGTSPALYVHESLAHWQGWSLSVPRPGKAVGDQGPTDVPNLAPAQGFQLQASFQVVPETLPQLRYGHRYLVRARTVDLAGNSLSVQEADDLLTRLAEVNQPQPVVGAGPGGAPGAGPVQGSQYQRFEPVSPPALVLREAPGEGESVGRLVLRSDTGEDTAACAVRLRAATSTRQPPGGYLPTCERHMVPPKVAHSAAEASGMFDAAFGASGQPGVTYLIALRDGGLGDTSVVDITTGNPVPIPPATGIDPVTGNTITRPSVEIVTGGGSAGAVLHHEDSLALPYLSDPLARGAVLFGLPGLAPNQAALIDANGTLTVTQTPLGTSTGLPAADVSALGSMTQVGFGDGWPQRLPFRLRVAEAPSPAPAPPQWDATARVLTVFLEKSQQCTVRLASFLLPGDIAVLGQWSWLVSSLPAQTLDPMALDLATAGALWALTPPRMITLVHAVQHPLKAPVISSMSTLRGPATR